MLDQSDPAWRPLVSPRAQTYSNIIPSSFTPVDDGPEPVFSWKEVQAFRERTLTLVLLMLLQSISSIIMKRYERLVQTHPVIVYSLTFLIGAGGNASAHSVAEVLRNLATGNLTPDRERLWLLREVLVGMCMGVVLSVVGFVRVYWFGGTTVEAISISLSLMAIVVTATTVGTILPLLFSRTRFIDPVHATPTVQVLMDIIGVTICCSLSMALYTLAGDTVGLEAVAQGSP